MGEKERLARLLVKLIYLHIENDYTDHHSGGAGQTEEQAPHQKQERERDIKVERARLIYLHVENDHTDHDPGGAGQPEEQAPHQMVPAFGRARGVRVDELKQ